MGSLLNIQTFLARRRGIAAVVSSALVSVLVVTTVVSAATTVGTNVSVDGTLSSTGNFSASSALYASSTALFTSGLTAYSSSTLQATHVGGGLTASSTALVTGNVLTYANATFGDAATDINIFTGTLNASTTALFSSGMIAYSSSTLQTTQMSTAKVGDGSSLTGIIAGYCNTASVTIAASSTGMAICTVNVAANAKLQATDRVFVQATSSLPASFVITAASSTASDTIQVRLQNLGVTGASTDPGTISLNFWAFR